MPMGDNPVSQLRRLRTELRKQRDSVGLTQREVADALDWSPSKLIRIERGPVGISVTDVRALLQHYEVTDKKQVEELVELARASKRPVWWDQYRDTVTPQFLTALAIESSAIRVRKFQSYIIPGVMQLPDYIMAVLESTATDPKHISTGYEIRLKRQDLIKPGGVEYSCLLDEAVLYRIIGSAETMRAQLNRLIELQEQPNITIRVVPFSAGYRKGMLSPFTIFDQSEERDDYTVQLEQSSGDRLIEEGSVEAAEYVQLFEELEKVALTVDESMALIARIANSGGES